MITPPPQDREKARKIVDRNFLGWDELQSRIAAALAAERERWQEKHLAAHEVSKQTIRMIEEEVARLREALENAEQFLDLYVNGFATVENGKHTLAHVSEALARPATEERE